VSPPARRSVAAARLRPEESVNLDGRFDEPVWKRAVPAGDFVQQEPANGEPATERTEVRVVFDEHRLYLGVTCFDSEPNRLYGNQMQRDQSFAADDRFMWAVDTYLNARSGYYFEINPSGAMGDGLITNGNDEVNRQWDGIWIARVRRGETGWTAEIEIPFRTLNFDPKGSTWGINFQRTVRRKNEDSLWSGSARNQGLVRVANAGLLTGLEGVSQGVGLDVKPYLVGTAGEAPGRGSAGLRGDAHTGVDVFYNLTPGLRTNFTVNTDFAETEVDDRQVNLTRFPLFFPEKREFFLEGSSFFDFSREPGNAVVPFFSRRIGLDAAGRPQKIDFGVKLTGQIGAQDVGVLQVRTAPENAAVGEDFTVARVKRRVFAQSYLGMVYTRRAVRGGGEPDRQTAGADFSLATPRFRGSQNLEFSGFFLWNTTPLGTGDNLAYGLRLSYPNDLWNARISTRVIEQNHDPAVGFKQRTGYRRLNPVVRFSPRPRQPSRIRQFSFEENLDLQTDSKNRVLFHKSDLTVFQLTFNSNDEMQVHVIPNYERLESAFPIHSGIVLPLGAEYSFTRYRFHVGTADRRLVSFRSDVELGNFYSGDRREVNLGITLRPRRGLLVNLESQLNHVNLAEGRFDTRVLRGVVNTQLSPWVSLSNNVQYDSVSGVLGWQSRFRWILRPGNDIYAVYTHNWIEDPFSQFDTLDRRLATKIVYTHRF
jgi:hypothetical protein